MAHGALVAPHSLRGRRLGVHWAWRRPVVEVGGRCVWSDKRFKLSFSGSGTDRCGLHIGRRPGFGGRPSDLAGLAIDAEPAALSKLKRHVDHARAVAKAAPSSRPEARGRRRSRAATRHAAPSHPAASRRREQQGLRGQPRGMPARRQGRFSGDPSIRGGSWRRSC